MVDRWLVGEGVADTEGEDERHGSPVWMVALWMVAPVMASGLQEAPPVVAGLPSSSVAGEPMPDLKMRAGSALWGATLEWGWCQMTPAELMEPAGLAEVMAQAIGVGWTPIGEAEMVMTALKN